MDLKHSDIQQLLGAYAIDAVDDDERQAVELHLHECPRCRAEVEEHRETAAMLAYGGAPAPSGVWDRLAAELGGDVRPPELAPVLPLDRRRRPVLVGLTSAAAAVIVALGAVAVNQERRLDDLTAALGDASAEEQAEAALANPAARRIVMRSPTGSTTATMVMLPDGTGYVVRDNLPALPEGEVYQLWALAGTTKISAGVLGRDPGVAAFEVATAVDGFALTAERAPGVVSSNRDPVVVGFVREA